MATKKELWVRAAEIYPRLTADRDQSPLTLKFGRQNGDETVIVDFINWNSGDAFLSQIISVPSNDLRDHLRKRLQIDCDSHVDFEISDLLAS